MVMVTKIIEHTLQIALNAEGSDQDHMVLFKFSSLKLFPPVCLSTYICQQGFWHSGIMHIKDSIINEVSIINNRQAALVVKLHSIFLHVAIFILLKNS